MSCECKQTASVRSKLGRIIEPIRNAGSTPHEPIPANTGKTHNTALTLPGACYSLSMNTRFFFLLSLIALLTFGASTLHANDTVRLPHLGSTAAAVLSPAEAQAYGASMFRQMRALNLVLDDPLADEYINDLGYRLVTASPEPTQHFTFFIARENVINAFAAPGGYIGINAGLITATRNQDELAAVMAHEISHITQHHLERAFEDAKKTAPLIALAMLGAIALGAGGAGGNAAVAAMAMGQGLAMQRQINFTRKDEAEADRVGMQTLARAGFSPDGMADFFSRMETLLRADSGGFQVPAMLQNHPVTALRIAQARARAHAIDIRMRTHPATPIPNYVGWQDATLPLPFVKHSRNLPSKLARIDRPGSPGAEQYYLLMRERIRVLSSQDINGLIRYYAGNLANNPGFRTPSNRYGYALALIRSGKGAKALHELVPLRHNQPNSLPIRLAWAHAKLVAGQHKMALALYNNLIHDWPQQPAVALGAAQALISFNQKNEGVRAEALLRPLLEDSDEPDIYRTYARAAELAGLKIRAAEAYADATFISGHPIDALDQLHRLIKRADLNYYQRARIEARIAYLTPIALELQKRNRNKRKEKKRS